MSNYELDRSEEIVNLGSDILDEEIFEEVIKPKGRKYLLRVQKRLAKLRDDGDNVHPFYTEEASDILDELEEKGFFSF